MSKGVVCRRGCSQALAVAFEYDTPKVVHIKSKKVGFINRIIQLAIIGYIIGYAIVWKKGYQEFDDVVSVATTKLKGVLYSNFTNITNPRLNHRIWDVADYVIPAQETNAFFVMTNVVLTENQTLATCPEDPLMADVNCTIDRDCPQGLPVVNGNGVRTGRCDPVQKVCEIYAWCPVEVDELPVNGQALLAESKRFTVLIKNPIEFPKFGVRRRNILEIQDSSYLQNCHFNASDPDDQLCPIFELGVIVQEAGENFDEIAVKGGVMSIDIRWDCNLDYDIDYCKPEYTFHRIDNKTAQIAKGWNFRYANYYSEDGIRKRDFFKAYGIRFVIKVTGQGGKFNVVPLLLNIGSGLGLLAVATVLCDIITLYILKKGYFYKEKKYLFVNDVDDMDDDRSGTRSKDEYDHLVD